MRKPRLVLGHKYLVAVRDAHDNSGHDPGIDHIAALTAQRALLIVYVRFLTADAAVLIAAVPIGKLQSGKCEEHVRLLCYPRAPERPDINEFIVFGKRHCLITGVKEEIVIFVDCEKIDKLFAAIVRKTAYTREFLALNQNVLMPEGHYITVSVRFSGRIKMIIQLVRKYILDHVIP